MIKQKVLLIFVSICAIWNSAKAQSYSVESFEGQMIKVHLTEKSTEKSKYRAKVYCLTDSLILGNYNGVKEVHVLSKNFLEIVYNTAGGTGLQSGNTVILSIKMNKINVVLLTNSYSRAFGGDIDGSRYVVKFNITGDKKSNFKLVADIYDRHNSNSSPQKSYSKNKKVILYFDTNQNIFYSNYKNINQSFIIYDPKTEQSNKQQISGSFPIIALGRDYHYYIKGEWYSGYDDKLFKDYNN